MKKIFFSIVILITLIFGDINLLACDFEKTYYFEGAKIMRVESYDFLLLDGYVDVYPRLEKNDNGINIIIDVDNIGNFYKLLPIESRFINPNFIPSHNKLENFFEDCAISFENNRKDYPLINSVKAKAWVFKKGKEEVLDINYSELLELKDEKNQDKIHYEIIGISFISNNNLEFYFDGIYVYSFYYIEDAIILQLSSLGAAYNIDFKNVQKNVRKSEGNAIKLFKDSIKKYISENSIDKELYSDIGNYDVILAENLNKNFQHEFTIISLQYNKEINDDYPNKKNFRDYLSNNLGGYYNYKSNLTIIDMGIDSNISIIELPSKNTVLRFDKLDIRDSRNIQDSGYLTRRYLGNIILESYITNRDLDIKEILSIEDRDYDNNISILDELGKWKYFTGDHERYLIEKRKEFNSINIFLKTSLPYIDYLEKQDYIFNSERNLFNTLSVEREEITLLDLRNSVYITKNDQNTELFYQNKSFFFVLFSILLATLVGMVTFITGLCLSKRQSANIERKINNELNKLSTKLNKILPISYKYLQKREELKKRNRKRHLR